MKTIKEYRFEVFILTFFAYAAVHCTRSSWSESKSDLKQQLFYQPYDYNTHTTPLKPEWADSPRFPFVYIGIMDFVFLISYAIGLISLGKLYMIIFRLPSSYSFTSPFLADYISLSNIRDAS